MQFFFSYFRVIKWSIAVVAVLVAAFLFYKIHYTTTIATATAKVERGAIENLVSVSGTVKLANNANLSFTQTGTIGSVLVNEGSVVTKGQILALLDQQKLAADIHDAQAYLAIQKANRDELLRGPSNTERAVTSAEVLATENELERTVREQQELVENAHRTLLSSDLVATPKDRENDDTPPTITGSYTCATEGVYTFTTYPSGGNSGYSYTLSGLGSGTHAAFTDTAQPFGTCGLFIQFAKNTSYGNQEWSVTVPNTRSPLYTTNHNAYDLAIEKQKNAVAAAEENYTRAQLNQSQKNDLPQNEAVARANASIAQAQARLEALYSDKTSRSIIAPFAGTVSHVALVPGESSVNGTITLVSQDAFELSVRIPEIDITHIALGDTARVHLDAQPDTAVTAKVGFISPVATEIDGVSYYEALLYFDTPPEWLRGGFNADVDIITKRSENVLRLPERYITNTNNTSTVTVRNGNKNEQKSVEIGFKGNDGFVEVKNLPEGFEVIAP